MILTNCKVKYGTSGKILKGFAFFIFSLLVLDCQAQQKDTTILVGNDSLTLPSVIIVSGLNTNNLLRRIKEDTTFYKAFRSLRIVGYKAENSITMYEKKGEVKASYNSTIRQLRTNNCRSMEVLQQHTTGDMLDKKGNFNYMTANMFDGLFLTHGQICGENNIVGNSQFDLSGKKGMEKHKEQLKMLFFNPGRRIPGIPFIGGKLDLYDASAREKYNYRLDMVRFFGHDTYRFTITPKPGASGIVIDNMTTWFDSGSMDVLGRTYAMSYHAGVYDFDVKMNVRLENVQGVLLPVDMQYNGNWHVIMKGREIGNFHAKLSEFKTK